MLPAYRMAQKVHTQLVRETSELQQRLVMNRALFDMFGRDTLPTERLLQGQNNVLTDAAQLYRRSNDMARERIAENLATIRELEKMFAEKSDADMEAFVKAMSDRLNADRRASQR